MLSTAEGLAEFATVADAAVTTSATNAGVGIVCGSFHSFDSFSPRRNAQRSVSGHPDSDMHRALSFQIFIQAIDR